MDSGKSDDAPGRSALTLGLLLAIAVLALGLRLAMAAMPVVHHADEVWQYLEPAYGHVTGLWIRTWDIRAGIRSWLLPVLLLPPVALGHGLDPRGTLHILLAREMMALAALAVVWGFWSLGRRHGQAHGLMAAFVGASWIELVYFAPRTSSDGLAMTLFIPALALLARKPGGRAGDLAAGVLAGLAFVLRIQLAPAIALALVGMIGWQRDRYRWVALGLLGGLVCDGLANFAMGEVPFLWIWRNVAINVMQGKSALFGTEPAWWYGQRLLTGWGWAAFVIVPGVALAARRESLLLAVALVVIAPLSVIPHKEYRFVTVAIGLFVYLGVIGSLELLLWPLRRWGRDARWALVVLVPLWGWLSLTVARSEAFADNWTLNGPSFEAMIRAGQVPGVCGIGVYRHPDIPMAAYSFINRPVPILMIDDDLSRRAIHPPLVSRAYNVALGTGQVAGDLAAGGYHVVTCTQPGLALFDQGYCVFARAGGCSAVSHYYDYNRWLERIGR